MDPNHARAESATPPEDRRMEHARNLASQLRALGQELERNNLTTLRVEWAGEHVLVSGKAAAPRRGKPFVELLGGLLARRQKPPEDVSLCFSSAEIEAFDRRGRASREDSNKMPDPYSLSQILRGTGSFLDRSGADPLDVSLEGKWVTIRYRTAEGKAEQVHRHLEYFYDYWATMYLRRSNRASAAN